MDAAAAAAPSSLHHQKKKSLYSKIGRAGRAVLENGGFQVGQQSGSSRAAGRAPRVLSRDAAG